MNTMKAFFDKKKVEKVLNAGWKIADANGENHTTAHFEWEGCDLVLHNHDVTLQKINNSYFPAFFINADLAVDMGWFIKKGNNNYALGPNLTIEIPDGVIPSPTDITSINPSSLGDKFWNYGVLSKLIRVTLTCNWRFINLNASFKNVLGSTKRTLFVYSDVSGSSVVGNQVTDFLREVNYKREGKGSQYFEPTHIQYIPVRKDVIDHSRAGRVWKRQHDRDTSVQERQMRGGSLTRFRPDDQSGGNFANEFKSLLKTSALGGVKGGWKGSKTGAPLGLPNIPGGIGGAKRGTKRGAKRASLDIINRVAKRKLDDIFGK